MKIVFWGTSEFAIPALTALAKENYNLTTVITQPDKPVGRKQILSPPPVKILAEQNNIKVLQPSTLKSYETFEKLNPDICIIAAYGKIIPKRYLEVPKYGFINIHPSLLPKYRGPSPIQTAILNGETETGVSIVVVDEEMDHGPILAVSNWPLATNKYYREIEKELAELGAKLLIETLPKYINGSIKPEPQDHNKATFTKTFSRKDGRINWKEPAEKTYNQIRALNSEPGTWTTWNGKILNIIKAEELRINLNSNVKPGTVVNIRKSIAIKTETCYLSLISVQLEGRRKIDAKSFVNGHTDLLGSILE